MGLRPMRPARNAYPKPNATAEVWHVLSHTNRGDTKSMNREMTMTPKRVRPSQKQMAVAAVTAISRGPIPPFLMTESTIASTISPQDVVDDGRGNQHVALFGLHPADVLQGLYSDGNARGGEGGTHQESFVDSEAEGDGQPVSQDKGHDDAANRDHRCDEAATLKIGKAGLEAHQGNKSVTAPISAMTMTASLSTTIWCPRIMMPPISVGARMTPASSSPMISAIPTRSHNSPPILAPNNSMQTVSRVSRISEVTSGISYLPVSSSQSQCRHFPEC